MSWTASIAIAGTMWLAVSCVLGPFIGQLIGFGAQGAGCAIDEGASDWMRPEAGAGT